MAAQAPEPEVGQDAGSQELKSAWEADLSSSKTDKGASETDHANLLLPELEEAPQSASLAPASGAAAPGTELAYALEPSYSDEEEVSLLLAHANIRWRAWR